MARHGNNFNTPEAQRDLYQTDLAFRNYQGYAAHQVGERLGAWRDAENAAFEARHSELQDPKVRGEIRRAAVEVLKEAGVSDAEIQSLAQFGLPASAQSILAMAAKQKLQQERLKSMTRHNTAPKTVRPGNADHVLVSRQGEAVDKAFRQFAKTGSVRDAAKVIAARRAK